MLSINLFSLKVSERVSVSHLNVRLLKLASYTIRQFDMYLPSPGHKTHYHPTLSLRYNTRPYAKACDTDCHSTVQYCTELYCTVPL